MVVEFEGGQEKAEMYVVIFRSSDGILHGDETRQDCRSGVIKPTVLVARLAPDESRHVPFRNFRVVTACSRRIEGRGRSTAAQISGSLNRFRLKSAAWTASNPTPSS
jgi:hypothetical protein